MVAQDTTFKQFKFNPNAYYGMPSKWVKKLKVGEFSKLQIFVNEKDSFQAKNLDIFTNYVLSFNSENAVNKWLSSCNMSFYQNQINFAIWCATFGCGVSVNDHLNSESALLSSLYRFHVYYQTRKILEEMACPIPGESIFNKTDNSINIVKYQKLCNEFDVSQNADFRFKGGKNDGLGTMYY